MPHTRRLILLPLLLATVSGCSTSKLMMNNQGYIADEELVQSVQPGVDNRQSVEKALGRPTLKSEWSDDVWFYVSRNTKQIAFARPRPKDQRILIVHFDKAGNVSSVERRGLEKVANISPAHDKTPTLGREELLLDDLFGNLGAVGTMGAGGAGPQ